MGTQWDKSLWMGGTGGRAWRVVRETRWEHGSRDGRSLGDGPQGFTGVHWITLASRLYIVCDPISRPVSILNKLFIT